MPTYHIAVTYTAKEGFTVEAATPEEAYRFWNDGNPDDPSVPGERDYDEYIGVERVEVWDQADLNATDPLFVSE